MSSRRRLSPIFPTSGFEQPTNSALGGEAMSVDAGALLQEF